MAEVLKRVEIALTSGEVFEARVSDKFLKQYQDDAVTTIETPTITWKINTEQIVSIKIYKTA